MNLVDSRAIAVELVMVKREKTSAAREKTHQIMTFNFMGNKRAMLEVNLSIYLQPDIYLTKCLQNRKRNKSKRED